MKMTGTRLRNRLIHCLHDLKLRIKKESSDVLMRVNLNQAEDLHNRPSCSHQNSINSTTIGYNKNCRHTDA